jgi:hypothetical protein
VIAPLQSNGRPNLSPAGGIAAAGCSDGVLVKNDFNLTATSSVNGLNIAHGVMVHAIQLESDIILVKASYVTLNPETTSAAMRQCPQVGVRSSGETSNSTSLPCSINSEGWERLDYWDTSGAYAGPSLETAVPVCQTVGIFNCTDDDPSSGFNNYYSPMPGPIRHPLPPPPPIPGQLLFSATEHAALPVSHVP